MNGGEIFSPGRNSENIPIEIPNQILVNWPTVSCIWQDECHQDYDKSRDEVIEGEIVSSFWWNINLVHGCSELFETQIADSLASSSSEFPPDFRTFSLAFSGQPTNQPLLLSTNDDALDYAPQVQWSHLLQSNNLAVKDDRCRAQLPSSARILLDARSNFLIWPRCTAERDECKCLNESCCISIVFVTVSSYCSFACYIP